MSRASRYAPPPSSLPVTGSPHRLRRCGLGIAGVALATTLAIGGTGLAPAQPIPAPTPAAAITADDVLTNLKMIDHELAVAVRTLRAAGIDKIALQAALAIKNGLKLLSSDQVTAFLNQLGLGSLTSSASLTTGARQVVAPAGSAIVAVPSTDLPTDRHTGYAVIPSPTSATTHVAWFNTRTLRGGFADVTGTDTTATGRTTPLSAPGRIRLAPETTGTGTVLYAVYGSTDTGSRNRYSLPALGMVDAS